MRVRSRQWCGPPGPHDGCRRPSRIGAILEAVGHHTAHRALLALSPTPGTIIMGMLLAVVIMTIVVDVVRRGHLGHSPTRKETDHYKATAQWVEMMSDDDPTHGQSSGRA